MQLAVICHDIRSVHNVGSIFRTADAAGVGKIYLCGITPAPLDRFGKPRADFMKVSLGAEKSVSWESAKDTASVIAKLKNEGWQILALEQSEKSVPYNDLPFDFPRLRSEQAAQGNHDRDFAIMVGPEVGGLPVSILDLADTIIEIPMFGKKESLNVSVAFGIAVFSLLEHFRT